MNSPRALERAWAAWLSLLTPRRVRAYPLIALCVVLAVGLADALGGFGKSPEHRVFGGDFLGFYSAGALVSGANSAALNDPEAQRQFQEQLFAHSSDQVALWVSPPYFAWLFAPLARLPYFLAFSGFLAASLGCLVGSLTALRRELSLAVSTPMLLWFGLQYYPTLHWLSNGQMTGLWLAVLVLAFILLRRGRDLSAGLVLSLLACKPTLGLGLVVALLAAGRVRALFGAALGGLCFLGLGFLTLPEAMRGYLQNSAALLAFVRSHGYNTAGLYGSFEFGTLLLDSLSPRLATLLGSAVALGLLLLIARLWWRRAWQPGTRAWDLCMAATLALGVIASPHLFVYDLMLLLLPLFILLRHFPAQGGLPLGGGKLLGLAALNWALGLLGPVLTVVQQEGTRRAFGASCAVQLGFVALLVSALSIAREAQVPPVRTLLVWVPEVFRAPHARLLSAFALLALLLRTPRLIWGDTWFNLVLGREIAESGLIHQNLLTEQGFGKACVDLQWLAHCVLLGVERVFGLPGVALLASALTAAAFLAAAEFALRRASATPVRTLLVGLFALVNVIAQTVARAQTFSLPLLVWFAWRLAEDARAPSRKVWWLVPGAVLWGNLHGSALLAPALAGICLVSRSFDLWREQRRIDLRQLRRDLLLTLCLSLALLVSPYGTQLFGYYASTFGNAAFRVYISEWQRPSLADSPEVVLLLGWVLVLLVAGAKRMRTFELLSCLSLAALSATSVRHATPLALLAAAFLPSAADAALGRHLQFELDRVLRFGARWLLPLALASFVFGIPIVAARVQRQDFPVAFTDAVARAAGDSRRLLVDEAHGDRMLWFHPELRGRVSHDARVETMPLSFLKSLGLAYAAPHAPEARSWLSSYDVVVVDRSSHAVLCQALKHDPDWRLFAEDPSTSAFRPASERQ